jgi:hypothetical protein
MAAPYPNVIPKTRTYTLGGQQFARQTLPVEMQAQSVADIQAMIRNITGEQTAIQIALGNPPQFLEVDGRTGKRVDDVNKRTVVLYGVLFAATAMRQVELELAQAITQSTMAHSGRLGNVGASWQWIFVPKRGTARPITSGSAPPFFGAGDQLALMPRDVPYATIVNRNVARGGRIIAPIGRKGRPAKSKQNRGFLFWAAEGTRKRAAFKQFVVKVVFSGVHMVPGEVMTRMSGTGMIVIRPRIRRVPV